MQHERILFFSVYASWNYHTQVELTLANALRLRGASVLTISCDGLFPVCDVHRQGLNPRKPNSCNDCQASTAEAMSAFGADYRWLSRFVPPQLTALARAWADALEVRELASARWKDRAVAEWALSSALFQGRRSRPDWSEPEFVRIFRDQLYGTVLALEGTLAVFDEYQPDLLVTLNGRFFAHRAAIEVARERNVRFVTHERGLLQDTLCWREGELRHDLDGEKRMWVEAQDTPLDPSQIEFVERVLHERRFGKGMSWNVRYSPLPEARRSLLKKLALDERPIIALFTSSEDEQATFPRWSEGAFQDGREWLEATVEIARSMPSHQFVIRMHPGLVSYGANESAVEHAGQLSSGLPENCRVVMPKDEVSSYTLSDAADVGVVYYTTMGLELAARGAQVLCVAAGWYGHAGFAHFVERKQDYARALHESIGRGRDVEVARRALRFAWQSFGVWSIPFTKIVEEPMHCGKRTYTSLAGLGAGRDATFDRICDFLLRAAPLQPRSACPASLESTAVETQHIVQILRRADVEGPGDAHEMIVRAEGIFEAGEAQEACDLLLQALEIDPRATRAWKDLGAILHALGHSLDAIEALEQALRIDPEDRDAATDLELVRNAQ